MKEFQAVRYRIQKQEPKGLQPGMDYEPFGLLESGGEGEADYYGGFGTNRIAGVRGCVIDDYSPKGKVKGCFGFRGIFGTVN